MKYLAAMLACAGVICAADFRNGQSARAVIGQASFTAQAYYDPNNADNTTSAATTLGGVSGLAWANGSLFVVDSNRVGSTPVNNRVVIYNNLTAAPFNPGSNLPAPNQEILEENFSSFIRCPVCVVNPSVIVGQPDFTTVLNNLTQTGLRAPAGVASDGKILSIADTDNNRVLIWNSIPTSNGAPADVVLGQDQFNSLAFPPVASQKTMRGPQAVWIQGTRLFVADTLDNRILIWNTIPTQNNQPADVVLGQPDFTTVQSASVLVTPDTTASDIISPTGVSSDGTHLFVADLGQNRVLIWNSIPTQNNQPADVVIGQPDFTSHVPNNSFTGLNAVTSGSTDRETPVLCTTPQPNLNDANGNPTYPQRCEKTLNFPRSVISDGTRLFISDSGNDRVLVYNTIPTANAPTADVVLGQPDFVTDTVSDSGSEVDNVEIASADSMRTPMGLAWDGANLYVSDPFSRRVVVYTASDQPLAPNAVLNAASLETFASAVFSFGGTITKGEKVTVTITDPNNLSSSYTAPSYSYTVANNDTFDNVSKGITAAINSANDGAGDPLLFARAEIGVASVLLGAKAAGAAGNNVQYSVAIAGVSSNAATLTVAPTSGTTAGGTDAARLAPGMLISIFGSGFTDQEPASAPGGGTLPKSLAASEVYIDGVRIPLMYVSPTQINAQIPFEFADSNGGSSWVRTEHGDGSVTVTNAVAVPLAPQNPGIFTLGGKNDPRPALAFQYSDYATAVVDIEGLPGATSVASVTIAGTTYSYTVTSTDVGNQSVTLVNNINGVSTTTTLTVVADILEVVRQHLIQQINADPNSPVVASQSSQFWYLILTAKTPGAAGNGITVTTSATASSNTSLTLTVLTSYNSALGTCCASNANSQIDINNPAVPGGFIVLYATGLGSVISAEEAVSGQPTLLYCPTVNATYPDQNVTKTAVVCTPTPVPQTGAPYTGPLNNTVISFVSAVAGGATANVFDASLVPGSIGVYRLLVQLSSSLSTNAVTPITVYQDVYSSNTVTIPVQGQ